MFMNIESAPIRWPDQTKHGISVSALAQDLILSLLNRDRKERLGQKNDVEEILAHPFFTEINIKKLQMKQLETPFIPKTLDLERLRTKTSPVNFKDLQETIIP